MSERTDAPVLLPQPRQASFSGRRVAAAAPRIARDPALPEQGYRIRIGVDGIAIDAADDAGEYYANGTLAQLTATDDGSVPEGEIADWPDLALRGVMLDIARDKVPALHYLTTNVVPMLAKL